jgi:hypothetical protein
MRLLRIPQPLNHPEYSTIVLHSAFAVRGVIRRLATAAISTDIPVRSFH